MAKFSNIYSCTLAERLPPTRSVGIIYARQKRKQITTPNLRNIDINSVALTDCNWGILRHSHPPTYRQSSWMKQIRKVSEISCHQWVVKFKKTAVLESLKVRHTSAALRHFNNSTLLHNHAPLHLSSSAKRGELRYCYLPSSMQIMSVVVNCMQSELFPSHHHPLVVASHVAKSNIVQT